MAERPILMTVESVRGILADCKSQTRRVLLVPHKNEEGKVVMEQPGPGSTRGKFCVPEEKHPPYWELWGPDNGNGRALLFEWGFKCPYGEVGDILRVREPWRVGKTHDGRAPDEIWEHLKKINKGVTVLYEAGGWADRTPFERPAIKYPDNEAMPRWAGAKRSSMFMPYWASRIFLEITDVRVERVQEISEADAKAEGCTADQDPYWKPSYNDPDSGGNPSAKLSYQYVWDEINGKRNNGVYAWSKNPFVWAISFRRIEQ